MVMVVEGLGGGGEGGGGTFSLMENLSDSLCTT